MQNQQQGGAKQRRYQQTMKSENSETEQSLENAESQIMRSRQKKTEIELSQCKNNEIESSQCKQHAGIQRNYIKSKQQQLSKHA